MLRTSERGTFRRCRWLWWLEFEDVHKPAVPLPPLRFGQIMHKSLARYYKPGTKRGPRPWILFEQEYERELKQQAAFGFKVEDLEADEKWAEAGDLGQAMLKHYVDRYGSDEEWEVLVTEQPFKVLVYKPWTYDPNHPPSAQKEAEPWFWYVGILDGVWRNRRTKYLRIVDHKTAKAIQLKYLSLDPQATAYWTWGLDWIYERGLLKPDEKPSGMLFNIMRKAFPDERPTDETGQRLNKDGTPSKRQPAEYFVRPEIYRDWNERELARAFSEAEFAEMDLLRSAGAHEDGSPPEGAYKNPGQFTCPGCWAFDICELHEMGADWREMIRLTTKPWQPYAEHETYAAETK